MSATVTAEHEIQQADIDAGYVENTASAIGDSPNGVANDVSDMMSDTGISEMKDNTVIKAKTWRSAAPSAGPARNIELGEYSSFDLDNGLKVYLTSYNDAPRVQTNIAVRAGSKNDPADATGLAHYLEHMLFKGTDVYGSLDFEKEAPMLDKIEALYEEY